jgi:hypothetical protein
MSAEPELLVSYTIFPNVSPTEKIERTDVPWSELVTRIRDAPVYPDKSHCPLISLCEYGDQIDSAHKCLRYAENVRRTFGVEIDYDGEQVSIEAGAQRLREARLQAVLYTSPSHKPEAPRWRAVLGLSEPALPEMRAQYVARVNRALGGIVSRESFTLSQSFFIGRVQGATYEVIETEGRTIDLAVDLEPLYYAGNTGNGKAPRDITTDDDLRAAFDRGEDRYRPMLKLSSRWAARGMAVDDIEAALAGMLAKGDSHNADGIDLRTRIRPLAESAVRKFGETRAPVAHTPDKTPEPPDDGGFYIPEALAANVSENAAASQPIPLVRPIAPAVPYPIDSLGGILAPAARAVMQYVQVPDALAAHAVLAGAALAAQAHADVETLGGPRPISLYMLTVAESGERKTAADGLARAPVDEHRKKLLVFYTAAMHEYKAAHEGYKLRLRQAKEGVEDPEALATALKEIREEPAPREPCFIASDPSAEGLFRSLKDGQFSQTLATDEGGQFFGSYAMSPENELRMIAMLSRLWDGSPIDRVRSSDKEHVTLYGRRLAVHLMAQPMVAAKLLGSPLYRSQGILARFLICRPGSRIGTRIQDGTKAAPADDHRLRRYWHSVRQLLELQASEDHEVGGLNPPCLALSPEARAQLVNFYNTVEVKLLNEGELSTVREFGSKAAEHACRIAGVMTMIAQPDAINVNVETMHSAVDLVWAYIREHVRLAGVANIPEEVHNAQVLLEWIASKKLSTLNATRVMQYGPYAIRTAPVAKAALHVLAEYGWLVQDGKRYLVPPQARDAWKV